MLSHRIQDREIKIRLDTTECIAVVVGAEEMTHRIPVDLLGKLARTSSVRMRECIALTERRIAYEQQLPSVQVGIIAYLRKARCA
ncbi:MAG: hypothetical protein ACI4QT_06070 [Kiritimatiellia bacterium]